MKKLFLIAAMNIAAIFCFAQRSKFNFNHEWKVFVGDDSAAIAPAYNDSTWKQVTLPYAWNEDEAFKKDIAEISTNIAWYRKKFKLPAIVQLQSTAVPVSNGLSTQITSFGLKGNLQCGPTPSTPSFTKTRNALTIVKATAGSNSDSAFASFDDNELTDWFNDGSLATAWIEYELEKPATVSEVTLKLNNFRTRSYPIRILVDGQEAFSGNTTTGLGYCTISCKRLTGTKVRIELINSSNLTGQSSTEVSGKKLDDGVNRNDANSKGRLSIIEVEIYEAITEHN